MHYDVEEGAFDWPRDKPATIFLDEVLCRDVLKTSFVCEIIVVDWNEFVDGGSFRAPDAPAAFECESTFQTF